MDGVRLPSPYRQSASPEPALDEAGREVVDGDLVPVFALLWIVSAVQVRAAAQASRCDPVDALAALALIILPAMLREPLRVLARRVHSSIRKT
jgi:hypothetical protein